PVPLAGMTLWLRADRGVTSGQSGVTAWADQSGAGHDFVPAGGSPDLVADVLNHRPIIRFNGTDDRLRSTSQLITGNQFTIFTVLSVTAGDYPWELGDGSNQRRVFYERGAYGGGSANALDIGHDFGNDAR